MYSPLNWYLYIHCILDIKYILLLLISPPPALCDLSLHTAVKLCTFGVCFRSEHDFMNCGDICMCVVNKQFEVLEFFLFRLC